MKQFLLKHKKAISGTFIIMIIAGITMSFQDTPYATDRFAPSDQYLYYGGCHDTIPEQRVMKMKDFDRLQDELDRTRVELGEELKRIDFSKIEKELEASLKSVDMDKVLKDVELSLKKIDLDRMLAEVDNSLKNLDLNYNQAEIEKAMTEARKDLEKAKMELKVADRAAIEQDLERAKADIEKAKLEIRKIDTDKIIAEAHAGIDKAKAELSETRDMLNVMEKDGLVDSKKGFTIEYKNKDLFIDGKKQTQTVTDKYRKYFKKDHFKIRIGKD